MRVKKIIAYTLSVLVLLFSIVAILGIWEVVDIEDLIARMFKSLMVILAAAAVVVLIFSILDRPDVPAGSAGNIIPVDLVPGVSGEMVFAVRAAKKLAG